MPTPIELLGGQLTVDAAELLSRSKATQRDVVVLSGTLLEGFGNLYSDLDLYVICEQLPMKASEGTPALIVREDGRVRRINEPLVSAESIVLDIQYYTFRELDTLARSLNTLYAESRRGTQIFRKSLHPEDEDLIHKLLTGRVLLDGSGTFDARKIFDHGNFCFLKYRNEVGGYAEFRDLVGSWTAGDMDTCLHNMRGYLISQVSGMMFLAGGTNPRPKWFVRKLGALGREYSTLRDELMLWMNAAHLTPGQKRDAIEAACALIDMTYSHDRWLLDTNPRYFCAEEALALTEQEFLQRDLQDRDIMTERQLRRRMFSASTSALSTLLKDPGRKLRQDDLPRLQIA
jgi:hypothetical protein